MTDVEIRIGDRTYKLWQSIDPKRHNVIEVGEKGGVRGVIVFHEYVDKSKGGEYWGGLGIHRPRRDKRYLSKEIGPVFLAICQAEEERKVKGRHYRY